LNSEKKKNPIKLLDSEVSPVSNKNNIVNLPTRFVKNFQAKQLLEVTLPSRRQTQMTDFAKLLTDEKPVKTGKQ